MFKKLKWINVNKLLILSANLMTFCSVNTTCNFVMHQSKLPEEANKFRKF